MRGGGGAERKEGAPGSFPKLCASSEIITAFSEKNEVCWKSKNFLALGWAVRGKSPGLGGVGGRSSSLGIEAAGFGPLGPAQPRPEGFNEGCYLPAHG